MDALNLPSIATGGGLTGLAVIVGLVFKYGLAGLKEKREAKRPGIPVASLTDATSANTVVVNSLKAVAEENIRLNQRVGERDKRIEQQNKLLEERDARIEQLEKLVDEPRSPNSEGDTHVETYS